MDFTLLLTGETSTTLKLSDTLPSILAELDGKAG